MTTYLIRIWAGGTLVLDGPDHFDVEGEFSRWRSEMARLIGEEPNIACYGGHQKWIARHVQVLAEYQKRYNCNGDFSTLFVEYLVRDHGFQRREHHAVSLV